MDRNAPEKNTADMVCMRILGWIVLRIRSHQTIRIMLLLIIFISIASCTALIVTLPQLVVMLDGWK